MGKPEDVEAEPLVAEKTKIEQRSQKNDTSFILI
jgi:hypothetical protein